MAALDGFNCKYLQELFNLAIGGLETLIVLFFES